MDTEKHSYKLSLSDLILPTEQHLHNEKIVSLLKNGTYVKLWNFQRLSKIIILKQQK